MTEQERERAIRLKLARSRHAPASAIPTGFPALDAALGIGGLPRGRIVELFGPASCGKTSVALLAAAHLQRNGMIAAWIDADHAFDPGYAAGLGVAVERLAVAQPSSAEEALEVGRRLAGTGALDLLVIDSAAALAPRLELETALGESGPGLQARILGSGLRRLAAVAVRTGCAVLVVNQARGRAGAAALEPETSAGGPSLKLYSAVRIALQPGAGVVRFRILKNRVAAAFQEGELRPFSGGDARNARNTALSDAPDQKNREK
ncbi:MAG: DNA recombination/repair protein RecA [Acidobacteriia bacterium]|nr:DNA recombination/repair protein RecA [Terriglobia bacterium]